MKFVYIQSVSVCVDDQRVGDFIADRFLSFTSNHKKIASKALKQKKYLKCQEKRFKSRTNSKKKQQIQLFWTASLTLGVLGLNKF